MKHRTEPFAPVLIVGLGNPGARYTHTLHNVGMDAVASLRDQGKKRSLITDTGLFSYSKKGGRIWVTPNVFMNESGKAVKDALRRFRLTPRQLLVIHDESDLPIGTSRLSFGRGAAGHRGVQSITDALGTKEFFRFRIGIRTHAGKAGTFVLKKMNSEERLQLHLVLEAFARNVNENENP